MEFKREGCTFTIPDSITVYDQMAYYSAGIGQPQAVRNWESAKTLIKTWDCPAFPNHELDIRNVTGSDVFWILLWAGNKVLDAMNELEKVPKNS